MKKMNCWEYMKCGREPGGRKAHVSGTCPVAEEAGADGLNEGRNGGRLCWVVSDSCCSGEVKCSALHHKSSCYSCEFRYKVLIDEGLLRVCRSTGVYIDRVESFDDAELRVMARTQ